MNELITKNIKIENLIYEIRGKQVMLASDVANLYNTKTKRINEVVKRNVDRFPETFCFQLTEIEFKNLWSQNATANITRMIRTTPYVFTEHGIIMLSGLLNSEIAAKMNVIIIDAFVTMRKYISNELIEQKYINNMVLKHNDDIKIIQDSLNLISEKENNDYIFFEGQIYDAYSLLMHILEKAKEEIIIIDNYAGRELFNLMKDIKTSIKIYSKNIDKQAILKYKNQYSNIEIFYSDIFHDRFIILDKSILYHSGSSLKI